MIWLDWKIYVILRTIQRTRNQEQYNIYLIQKISQKTPKTPIKMKKSKFISVLDVWEKSCVDVDPKFNKNDIFKIRNKIINKISTQFSYLARHSHSQHSANIWVRDMPRPAAEAVTSQARRSQAHAQIIRKRTANYEKQQLLTWCNICRYSFSFCQF